MVVCLFGVVWLLIYFSVLFWGCLVGNGIWWFRVVCWGGGVVLLFCFYL